MAEFILRDMAQRAGVARPVGDYVPGDQQRGDLNGIGNPLYPPAAAELDRHGIPYTNRQAVRLRTDDYAAYDLFIGMDSENLRNIHRMFGGDLEKKIRRMMAYTDRGGDVTDPWYSGRFDIRDGCAGLLQALYGQTLSSLQ